MASISDVTFHATCARDSCKNARKLATFRLPELLHKKIILFWDVTPCNLIDQYQHFGGTFSLHPHVRSKVASLSSFEKFTNIQMLLKGYFVGIVFLGTVIWRLPYYRMWCCLVWKIVNNISEELASSIFRVNTSESPPGEPQVSLLPKIQYRKAVNLLVYLAMLTKFAG